MFSLVGVNHLQTALRHLQSKEFAMDTIVDDFRRNGEKLINKLLERQSTEFDQVAAAFDERCIRLGRLFEESATHAKTIQEKVSNEDDQNIKDWKQMKAEHDEELKRAKAALAALQSL
jgi:hypothetical protein